MIEAAVNQTTIEGPDITNYWQYFNLERDPFAMSIEEALVYLPTYWEEMLDLIQYLVHYKNQLVVVTGESGTGKTTLAELLSTQVGEGLHIAKISAEPHLDAKRLIEFLSDAFAVPWKPEHTIEQALDEQLQGFQRKERNCLLVIDNAQLLPTETLEALLFLVGQQSEAQMRFHTVLLGEVALQLTLQRMLEPSEEGLIHFLNLEPLSVEETQQYLNHRLTASGWQNENPMSEEIVARIFRLSEGNAARINRIARRFLLDMLNDQDNAEQKTFGKKYMTRLLGGCLIVAFLALIGVWAWRANNESPASVPARPSILVNGQPLVHHGETQASAVEPLAPPPPATPTSSAVLPITNLNTPAATAAAPTPVSATPPPLPSTATLPTEKVVTTPTPAKAALASSVAPSQKPKVKAIDKKSSGKYSIQLIALRHSQNVNQFIKQNHLQGKVTVIKTQKQGKPVTVVLYGRYKTLREAEKDIAHLPPNLLNAGPWPREIPGK